MKRTLFFVVGFLAIVIFFFAMFQANQRTKLNLQERANGYGPMFSLSLPASAFQPISDPKNGTPFNGAKYMADLRSRY